MTQSPHQNSLNTHLKTKERLASAVKKEGNY